MGGLGVAYDEKMKLLADMAWHLIEGLMEGGADAALVLVVSRPCFGLALFAAVPRRLTS